MSLDWQCSVEYLTRSNPHILHFPAMRRTRSHDKLLEEHERLMSKRMMHASPVHSFVFEESEVSIDLYFLIFCLSSSHILIAQNNDKNDNNYHSSLDSRRATLCCRGDTMGHEREQKLLRVMANYASSSISRF